MKKLLTMLSVICVFALTVTAFAIFSSADGPTVKEGDIIEAQSLVDNFKLAATAEEKLDAAKKLNVYLFASPVSDTVAKLILGKIYEGQGEEKYLEYKTDVEKVMAYGAVLVMESYDEDAKTYECRTVMNWASRFMEYKIAGYTLDEVKDADFFNGATEAEGESEGKTIGELYSELSAHLEKKISDKIDSLSASAFADYSDGEVLYQPDFSIPTLSIVANKANTKFEGIAYENGYRRSDYLPTFGYVYNGFSFSAVEANAGEYDAVKAGMYVIFDEGVTDFYATDGASITHKENYAKRNYIYDTAAGGYLEVAEGEGLYDLLTEDGYAKLLKPDPYYHFDMTGVRVTSSVPYGNWTCKEAYNAVLQFDASYFDDNGYMAFSAYFKRIEDSANSSATYLTISDGDIVVSLGGTFADGSAMKSGYRFEDVIVPGRWTNVALAFNGSNADLYIDYEYVGTLKRTFEMTITGLVQIRARVNGSNDMGFAWDNIVIYRGTTPRQLDKFDTMSDEDKFVFFGDYLSQEGGTVTAKMFAYSEMEAALGYYFVIDPEHEGSHIDGDGNVVGGAFVLGISDDIKNAVKQYFSFDYEEALEQYKEDNVKGYVSLVDEFCALERRYDTIGKRTNAKNDILDYVRALSADDGEPIYINVDSAAFQEAENRYTDYVQLLENDIESLKFVSAMESYKLLTKYNKKYTQFLNADQILNSITIDESITAAGETRLTAAYALYNNAPAELEDLLYKENTKNLAMYISYTKQFDTIESWEERYDELSYPISKAREIINTGKYYKEGSYDAYGDISELIDWYNLINDYFYDALQLEHIDYIEKLHAKYMNTESYMEKLGICTEAERYLTEEDIDPTNERLQQLSERNKEYLLQIRELEGSYTVQRDNNTERFVALTKKLEATDSYNQIVEYLDEILVYYYSMTVGATDDVTEEEFAYADEVYRYYIEYEKKIVECSRDFIILCAGLTEERKLSEIYGILSDMFEIKEYISEEIDGVSAALEKYESAYSAYEAKAAPVRSDVSEIERAIVSLRANCDSKAIMYLFVSLLNGIAI